MACLRRLTRAEGFDAARYAPARKDVPCARHSITREGRQLTSQSLASYGAGGIDARIYRESRFCQERSDGVDNRLRIASGFVLSTQKDLAGGVLLCRLLCQGHGCFCVGFSNELVSLGYRLSILMLIC